jgi:hypothetical protein
MSNYYQETFRCKHYPSAINNLRDGIAVCEHGCHTTALRWWDNGFHSEGIEWCDEGESPYLRRWDTSYTKKVVDELELLCGPMMVPYTKRAAKAAVELLRQFQFPYDTVQRAAKAAAELLRQYHRDLHLPYQQRDEARAELKRVKEDLARERLEFARLKQRLLNVIELKR